MAITEARLRELLAEEEVDYAAAAVEAGPEGLELLDDLVTDPDAGLAARAASLAGFIGRDSAHALAVVPVLTTAIGHADEGVRSAAAHGASGMGVPGAPVVLLALADASFSVRFIALSLLPTPLPAALAAAVQLLASTDPEAFIRTRAAALLPAMGLPDAVPAVDPHVQIGGEGLADQLVGAALNYARVRLVELRNTALGSVPSFAAAAGVPGFADPAGAVAALLSSARAELDLVPHSLTAGDFAGAAARIGRVLGAVGDAAAAIPGAATLPALLAQTLTWPSATGIVRQLGLSVTPPALTRDGSALRYRISAPAGDVAGPIPFRFDAAALAVSLRLDGSAPAMAIALTLEGLTVDIGRGPVAGLVGGSGSARADIEVGLDTASGLTLGGGASTRVVVPARAVAGPLQVSEFVVELPQGQRNAIGLGATVRVAIGPIQASVEGVGVVVHIDPATATGAGTPLSIGGKEPTGIGLVVDTGLVRGGGYLGVRPTGYGGALQLRLGPVEVKAVGLLTVEPRFALVIVMSVEFLPAIDLSFGFTLNAVGGVVGIEHRLDADALRAGFSTGALDHIMFPADPVAAAPAILTTLEKVFPVDRGSVVVGPMVEVGWGRPVSFLTAQLGVVVSLPDPLIVIIGKVRIALPAPQLPIVDLRATVYGEITPEYLLIRVSLNGSRIAGFSVGGDIGFLVRWGGGAEFAISAGGFHPRYAPPPQLADMQRLGMDLSPPAILTLRSESYFALTSNSVQLGSRIELGADIGVADISGYFAFDALILFSPRFGFLVDVGIGLTVRVFGVTLLGVRIDLQLSGTSPWRAEGSAEVEVLWATVDIDVGPFTWGEDDNPPPGPADPRQLVFDALHRNPGSWQVLTPPDADRVVRLAPTPVSETDVTVHPMGLFDVRQHAVPLETVITRVGANPVPAGRQRVHLGVPLVDGTPAGTLSEVTDLFSAGSYVDLTDDEKLSRPSFEPMPAGARIRPPGERAAFDAAREAQLRYETFVCDEDGVRGAHSAAARDTFFLTSAVVGLTAGAAGRSELRGATRYATRAEPIALADPGEVQQVSMATVTATAPESVTYTHAAEALLPPHTQLARLGVA